MKKLLMIAILSLFVANAYALDAKIYGSYETGGTWEINDNAAEEDGTNSTYWRQFLRIWAEISPEPGTKIVMRVTPHDRRMGNNINNSNDASNNLGGLGLDRAWIQYDVIDGMTVYAGRLSGNNYAVANWGQGWYNASYKESGARDGVKVTYKLDDTKSFFFQTEKHFENSTTNGTKNGRDADAYIAGAALAFNDFHFFPRLAYYNEFTAAGQDRISLYSAYLGFGYLPATGINVVAAAAYVGGDSGQGAAATSLGDDSYAAFGGVVDVAWVADNFKAGLAAVYSSFDDEKGFFSTGGDFERTIILDDAQDAAEIGVPASTILQAYGEIYLLEKSLTIAPAFTYFFTNIDEDLGANRLKNGFLELGEDTNGFEFDVKAIYSFTSFTEIEAGYGIAIVNDMADSYDTDPMHKLYWTLTTKF